MSTTLPHVRPAPQLENAFSRSTCGRLIDPDVPLALPLRRMNLEGGAEWLPENGILDLNFALPFPCGGLS